MATDDNQRKVFDFLLERLETQAPFARKDLEKITTWKGKTFSTYWSKQLKGFVAEDAPGQYRVTDAFRRYTRWDTFRQHVTQVRKVYFGSYEKRDYGIVRVYEFFMPLTNEGYLREALDALFFKDKIEARLRSIPALELTRMFPRNEHEPDEAYMERIYDWLSARFVGYSIYHVSGRYRAAPLATRADASRRSSRYLVDETTAVTRFIFPCESREEAELVAFFFTNLFVRAIIEVVNGEDEIWMVESGMENRLHRWQIAQTS